MIIDFKAIHKVIKDHIDSKGFKYLTIDKWFNFELDLFPAPTHNSGYAIKPGSGQKSEEYEANDWMETPWAIEFCLSSTNDSYLKKIGSAYDSVKSLEGTTSKNIAEIEFLEWDMQNYDKHVILTFVLKVTINE
jgi:hypothetical protein